MCTIPGYGLRIPSSYFKIFPYPCPNPYLNSTVYFNLYSFSILSLKITDIRTRTRTQISNISRTPYLYQYPYVSHTLSIRFFSNCICHENRVIFFSSGNNFVLGWNFNSFFICSFFSSALSKIFPLAV